MTQDSADTGTVQAPEAAQPPTGRGHRRWRRAYQLLCVATVLAFLPVSVVRFSSEGYVRSLSSVPAEPVGIVFGAAVAGNVPSPYLASRLNTALALWRARKFKVFLVSGDNSRPSYNEPEAMREYLVAHGVPQQLVVLDYAGFDTWETCVRARRVFGVTHAIVVSQSFHVPRAVYLCRAAGIRGLRCRRRRHGLEARSRRVPQRPGPRGAGRRERDVSGDVHARPDLSRAAR